MEWIDTHCHIDGEEFNEDREAVITRARVAGVCKVMVPAIDLPSSERIIKLCSQYPDYLYPMVGLHPEEVRSDWPQQLSAIRALLKFPPQSERAGGEAPIAIGEVGLDFYWSREFEKEQMECFEEQVRWSVETQLPLMIHCRKAQNELVAILKKYERELPGGVFHCFTGNEIEAQQLLQFDRFVLGIGGVLTFKKSHLPEVLPKVVPLDRIVIETDAPYLAPVPMRGKRNEPAYTQFVLQKLAESYGINEKALAEKTNANVSRIFNI